MHFLQLFDSYFLFIYSIPLTDLYIRVGNINITEGERHELVRAIVHEDFNFTDSLINDIAIVEVFKLAQVYE